MKRSLGVIVVLFAIALAAFAYFAFRDTHASFGELRAELEKRWDISDSHFGGENAPVVVVFEDAHIAAVEKENAERVSTLHEIFPLDVVLLENIAIAPDAPENVKMNQTISRAIEIDQEKILTNAGKGAGKTLERPEPSSKIYDRFFSDPRFDAFGFEDAEVFAQIAPLAIGEETLDQYSDIVTVGYTPICLQGRYHHSALLFIKVAEVLNQYAPGYPRFDIERLSSKKDGLYILGKEDCNYIGEMMVQHRIWTIEHGLYPRNKIAVENSLKYMKAKKYRYGALIIGADHLRKHPFRGGKTVQEHLKEQGVSYIVVAM